MRPLVRLALQTYRRSPLHPGLGRALARLLATISRLRGRRMFVQDLGSFRLHVDLEQRIDAMIYYSGSWEPHTVASIQKFVPVGGTAIDVGANIGFLTLVMAACVGRRGRVIAFEPTSWTYTRLCANMALNDVPQVVTVQLGLSDRERVCEPADIPYGYRLDGRIVTMREAIRMSTLDAYLAAHPVTRMDFIKCDTDGMEEAVFHGAIEALHRFRPVIHFELFQGTASDEIGSRERMLGQLAALGYRFYREETLSPFADQKGVARQLLAAGRAANVVALPHA